MKETLYEEENNHKMIELNYIEDQNSTIDQLKNNDNNKIKPQEVLKEDKLECQYQKRYRSYSQNNLLNIIPQTKIKAYAFDIFKLFFQQYRKYFSICKAWSIKAQVLLIYLILLFVFLVVIIATRVSQIENLLDTQSNKNYYNSIVIEMIDKQRDIKIELDKLNNEIRMRNINDPIIFLQIYTNELIDHKIFQNKENDSNENSPFDFNSNETNNDSSTTYYKDISKGFILKTKLKEIVESPSQGKETNLLNLIPFYYHFTPVLFNQLKQQGLDLEGIYYYANNATECASSLFFKYPLEIDRGLSSDSNTKPMDKFIDPVPRCFLSSANEDCSSTEETLKRNWFSKLDERETKNHSAMIKLEHIDLNIFNRKKYLMNYRLTINSTLTFLFALKFNAASMMKPCRELNSNEDTLNFNFLSIVNSPEKGNAKEKIESNKKDSIKQLKGYDSDESSTIICDVPEFIANMYLFSIQTKPSLLQSKLFNQIIKYSEMDKIREEYDINYYFDEDVNFFHLLVFLNEFLHYYKDYTLKGPNDHPFLSFNYSNYYSFIRKAGIDCLKDFCYFNDCDSSHPLYIDPQYSQYMPNCYCLPLYSVESFEAKGDKNISEFHSQIQYKDYFYNSKTQTYTNYFNLNDKREFTCRMNFNRKSAKQSVSSFNTKISLQKIQSNEDTTMLLMFLLDNKDIDNNIKNKYDEYINGIMWVLYLIYAIFLCLMVIALTFFMYRNVFKLTRKMKKFEEYRKKIIPLPDNTINCNNKVYTENNNDNEASQFLNFKALSLSKIVSFFETKEEDELDKLMNLISTNIDDFKIDFSINGNIDDNIREIQKQYHEKNKINDYKSQFYLNRSNKPRKPQRSNNVIFRKESIEKQMKRIVFNEYGLKDSNKDAKDNYSLNLLYEMLSMSNKHLLDFNSLKPNFYHIEDTTKSFVNFSALDEDKLKDDNEIYSNEINNIKKIDNGIKYYIKNVHSYWKQRYNQMKTEEKKSPQANYI